MNKKMMMMLLFPVIAFAVENISDEEMAKIIKAREEWTREYFAKQGSPLPDGGIVIIPEKKMSTYKESKQDIEKRDAEIKKYGYINDVPPQIATLLQFKEIAKKQFVANAKPYDDGLRHEISELDMAYDFHGVPKGTDYNIIGVAPTVTYIKDKGWAGATQYFEKVGVGNCSYTENNLKFSHGSIVLAKEKTLFLINGKATMKQITGRKNNGFLYQVDWYDDDYFHELACANEYYAKDIMNKVVQIALDIDNNS